ncbi:unnamed protein product, partial [Onchocerca ochengi]
AVKSVISKCTDCKRWKARPFKLPVMPTLLEFRVTRSRAFENVGLDYLGPITVKSSYNTINKRWIALFTCFTTRAVHLEMVEDLSGNKTQISWQGKEEAQYPTLITPIIVELKEANVSQTPALSCGIIPKSTNIAYIKELEDSTL